MMSNQVERNLKTLRSAPKSMIYEDLRKELVRANIEVIVKVDKRFNQNDIIEIKKATYNKNKDIYYIILRVH